MKKIYLFLIALLTSSAMSFTANAITVTVNFDNPEAVIVKFNYEEQVIVAGDNVFSGEQYASITISAVDPYAIKSITDVTSGDGVYSSSAYGSIYLYDSYDGHKFEVVTYNKDESRTASCNVWIDNAANAYVAHYPSYEKITTLVDGDNVVKYNPETENQLYFYSTSGKAIYRATLNGEVIEPNYSSYTVNLTDGCNIRIETEYPDINYTVNFEYSDEAYEALDHVTVDGVTVEDFDGMSLTAKVGSRIGLNANSNYKIDKLSIDDVEYNWSGSYEYTFNLNADAKVSLEAHPYGNVSATVIIEDPEAITFYKGYSYLNDVVTLHEGANPITVSEKDTYVSWNVNDGYYITAIYCNDEALSSYTYGVYLKEGDKLRFDAGKIVYDKTAAVWIDKKSAATNYYSFADDKHNSIEVPERGYTTFTFYDGLNPFVTSWYGEDVTVGQVYLNNTKVEPMYEGSANHTMTLKDGDVVKVFLAEEPVEYTVDFTVEDGIETEVKKDVITNVADLSATQTDFQGTEYQIVLPNEDIVYVVTVNGEELEAVDGVYAFTVAGNTTVDIKEYVLPYIEPDKKAIVWVDNLAAATDLLLCESYYYEALQLEGNGYNEVAFHDAMNPITISWSGNDATVGKLFLNDVAVEPVDAATNTHNVTVAHNDIVKIYLATEPTAYKVTFSTQDEIVPTVIKDRVVAVADVASPVNVLNGTEVSFTLDTNEAVEVKINEEKAEAVDGAYTFVVNADTNVSIAKVKEEDGIETIEAESIENADVYTLTGIKIANTTNLPAGLYIVNGTKKVVR